MIGVIETAGAVVTFLSPFMPYLKKAGEVAGKKLVEMIAEKGGEAAWQKAQALWGRITGRSSETAEVDSAANLVAAKPGDETYQGVFAKALADYLEKNPDLAKELVELMGGEQSVQEVLAERGSWIEGVRQEMAGAGRQTMKATDNSAIRNATQIKT